MERPPSLTLRVSLRIRVAREICRTTWCPTGLQIIPLSQILFQRGIGIGPGKNVAELPTKLFGPAPIRVRKQGKLFVRLLGFWLFGRQDLVLSEEQVSPAFFDLRGVENSQ